MLKRIVAGLLAGVVFIGSFAPYENVFGAETTETVTQSEGVIASGSYGNTSWVIDADGKLTVEGTGEVKKEQDVPGWHYYRDKIKSAEINVTGMTDASYLFARCSNMKSVDVSRFDTSNVTSMKYMFYACKNLEELDVSGFDTENVTDMSDMFYICASLTELDVSGFDTGKVTDMQGMFKSCSSLTELDVSGFDTGKVTDMQGMFANCRSLTELDVSGIETGNVTDMSDMFNDCESLTELDVSGFDTGKVTDMQGMFTSCWSLTELDVSEFDTGNVTGMGGMFSGCSKLTELDVSGFDTENVTSMIRMFNDCASLTELDVSGFDTSNVTDMKGMFNTCYYLTELDVSGFDTDNVTDMNGMFDACIRLTELDVSGFNTSNVTDMKQMFHYCDSLTELDVSRFDTGNVTDMKEMFSNCNNLIELDVSGFNTSNVIDMSYMFSSCSGLTKLDVSGFDTGKVTDMQGMFANCRSLTKLDVSNFITGNVTDMKYMFDYCTSLTELDVSRFDTSNVTNMSYMFEECRSLKELGVSGFNTSNVTDMNKMFYGCSSLISLDISSFDMDSVEDYDGDNGEGIQFLKGCSSLTTIYTPYNVGGKIELPSSDDTWYLSDGTVVSELPQNLSYSVALGKNYIPEEKHVESNGITITEAEIASNINISKDKSAVYIVDGATGKPISLARVWLDKEYWTKDDGSVEIDKSGLQTLKISKGGYVAKTVKKELKKGTCTIIVLSPDNGDLQILSAELSLTGADQDVLNGSAYLVNKDFDLVTDGIEKDFQLTVESAGSPVKYQLLQNGKVIQESADGTFQFSGKYKNGKDGTVTYYVEELSAGYELYVRAIDKDGKAVKQKLGIRISEESTLVLQLKESENKTGNMSIGDKLQVTIPSYIPIFGNSELNFGFEDKLPITIDVDTNGKVKVGLNLGSFDTSDSEKWEEKKKEFNNLAKKALKMSDAALTSGSTPQSFGAGLFSVKGSIMGYGEGYVDEKTDDVCISVKIVASVNASQSFKQYCVVTFIPVYITLKGEASMTATGSLNLSWGDREGWFFNGGDLEMEPSIGATVTGGIGEDGIASVSASGSLILSWLHRFSNNYNRVVLDANITGKAELYCWSYSIDGPEGSWVIYDSNQKKSAMRAAVYASTEDNDIWDMSDAEPISMDYLNKRSEKMLTMGLSLYSGLKAAGVRGTQKSAEAEATDSTAVLQYAYDNASPRLVQAGEKLYLFYLDGVSERDTQNQTALFYKYSLDDGTTWSAAYRADAGANETADYNYDVLACGDKIYVVWSDSGSVYTDDILEEDATKGIAAVSKDMNLMLAVIDSDSGDVISTTSIPTDGAALQPQIAADEDGNVYITWITNDVSSEEGLFSYENNMGIGYASSTDNYQVQYVSIPGKYLLSLDAGLLESNVYAVVAMDTDGDLNTQDDREIYTVNLKNGSLSQMTSNDVVDSVPSFGKNAGADTLFWYQNGNIAYTVDGQQISLVFDSENLPFIGQEFSLLEGTDGESAIVWTTTSLSEEAGVDVYCTDFDGSDWSAVYRFGSLKSEYTAELSGYMDGSDYHMAYLGKSSEDDALYSHIYLYTPSNRTDTSIEWYAQENGAEGESYPLNLTIYNNGNETITSLNVASEDGSINDTITGLSIAPGTSYDYIWSGIQLPDNMTQLYESRITVSAPGETDTEDNLIELSVGAPDFAVEANLDFSGGDQFASIVVTNNGILSSDAILEVYKDESCTEQIFQTSLAEIAAGESRLTILDLTVLDETAQKFYFVVTDEKNIEQFTSDNETFLYVGKGISLEYEDEPEHDLTKVEKKEPGETETGNQEYWKCSICGKVFADEDGKTETSLEAVTIPATGQENGGDENSDTNETIVPIVPVVPIISVIPLEPSSAEDSSAGESSDTTVTTKTDVTGNLTSAKASSKIVISGSKMTITSELLAQLAEAAGKNVKNADVTVVGVDKEGNTKFKVIVNTADFYAGNVLHLYKYNTKTGVYKAVNSKKYTVSDKGSLTVSASEKATYKLVSATEAKAATKQIKATYAAKKTAVTLKTGKTTTFTLKKGADQTSIKSITYTSSDKKVATVSKKGKITAKAAGKATISAKITLKNGKTKTVKMKVTVK